MTTTSQIRKRQRYRRRLLASDPHCFYCGRELTFDTSTIDHLVPRSKGGTDHFRNLRLACNWCNLKRGDRDFDRVFCDVRRGCGLILTPARRWRAGWKT